MNNKNELIIEGSSLSPGIAIGVVFPYRDILTRDISSYCINKVDLPYELKRIEDAFSSVRSDLYQLSRNVSHNISSEDGNIFEAQRLMIEDDDFKYSFEKKMRDDMINAEQVVKNVFRRQIERFDSSSNDIIKSKADDLRDIFRKVLRSLLGVETSILSDLPEKAVIFAKRLLPSDTVMLDQKNIEGIIVQEGSVHAHSALLARSLGIPALCTKGQSIAHIGFGNKVIIDSYSEKTIISPTSSTIEDYKKKKQESPLEIKKRTEVINDIVATSSGKKILIMANANTTKEVELAIDSGCDGIGLFRTETIYLQSKQMPEEDDLYNSLKDVLKNSGNKPVTIRLLDIGGDKRLPYFEMDDEFSPFLGVRGVRLLLSNLQLLKTQLRALIRLSSIHKIRVLIPMVSVPEEIIEVRNNLNECIEEFGKEIPAGEILLGSMIETPSSAIAADKIVRESDFISIGTNDLTQYIMAASRENPNVADLYEKGFDYILPLLERIVIVCKEQKKECCVCGELANDEILLKKLIECGIYKFSVSSFRIPHLKKFVQNIK